MNEMDHNTDGRGLPTVDGITGATVDPAAEFKRLLLSYRRMASVGIMDAPAVQFNPIKAAFGEGTFE